MTHPLGLNQGPQAPDPNQPHVRILICHVCKSIQEVPDYDGPPEFDQLMDYAVAPHQFPSGTPHKGINVRVPEAKWQDREFQNTFCEELEGLLKQGGADMSEPLFYDIKQNFKEEAFSCWKEHRRTTDCGDYQSKSKALYADTKAERKAEGLDISLSARPKHFLCDYCPVQSIVDQKKRKAAKMYDKQQWE